MEGSTGGVRIISRRMVRRESTSLRNGMPPEPENIHLTLWDLRMITVDYIQNGQHAVEHLVSSFARALARFYPLADRHTVAEINDGASPPSLTISLCCNDKGAEFVHAVAPGVTVAVSTTPLYILRMAGLPNFSGFSRSKYTLIT